MGGFFWREGGNGNCWFYAMLIMALLQLRLKQHSIDIHHDAISSQTNIVSNQAIEDNEPEKNYRSKAFLKR
jgi:hypothetical protein